MPASMMPRPTRLSRGYLITRFSTTNQQLAAKKIVVKAKYELISTDEKMDKAVDFKTGMKRLVRRTCVSSVGYVELGFKREMGVQPEIANAIVDATERLAHMQQLAEGLADGQFDETSSERAELEASLAAYQATPEVVMSEGLIVDYPASTSVILRFSNGTTRAVGLKSADMGKLQKLKPAQRVPQVVLVRQGRPCSVHDTVVVQVSQASAWMK